ncbi:hypothetical protein BpHYR1_022848 [Brachionus plicatilis]|uniref:EB domain-containing protein n=1 Tax=Brachionus plicatilis TaxID=10195 RepID=A0A3M7Q0C2_BRAPC|nr:hypothetical protein BpHYR1_022848 [Brachionus plicatilis]
MSKVVFYSVCDETKYFDSDICLARVTEFEQCFSTDMCLKDMVCNDTRCVCSDNYYYSDKCVPQKLLNQRCEKDFECWSEKGLVCDSNICTCELSYTWSITLSKCLLTYGKKGCNNNNECNQDEKLICVDENFNQENESQLHLCNCISAKFAEFSRP